jgi:isopentenyl-diphosphate delta-isomerase
MREMVILVDRHDRQIGVEEKMKAHREGKLHRAFSIFIFNQKSEMLLQKRAPNKYHSGGLWTNACCSHPRPGESVEQAAVRRLKEEMGFHCALQEAFHGLIEHEFDHVFVGTYDGEIHPNRREVVGYRWLSPNALKEDVRKFPEAYTTWFKLAVPRTLQFVTDY